MNQTPGFGQQALFEIQFERIDLQDSLFAWRETASASPNRRSQTATI